MRSLIITSCMGEKAHTPETAITLEDFQTGVAHVQRRQQKLMEFRLPASIYAAEQCIRLMRGIESLVASFSLKLSLSELELGTDRWTMPARFAND